MLFTLPPVEGQWLCDECHHGRGDKLLLAFLLSVLLDVYLAVDIPLLKMFISLFPHYTENSGSW